MHNGTQASITFQKKYLINKISFIKYYYLNLERKLNYRISSLGPIVQPIFKKEIKNLFYFL